MEWKSHNNVSHAVKTLQRQATPPPEFQPLKITCNLNTPMMFATGVCVLSSQGCTERCVDDPARTRNCREGGGYSSGGCWRLGVFSEWGRYSQGLLRGGGQRRFVYELGIALGAFKEARAGQVLGPPLHPVVVVHVCVM